MYASALNTHVYRFPSSPKSGELLCFYIIGFTHFCGARPFYSKFTVQPFTSISIKKHVALFCNH